MLFLHSKFFWRSKKHHFFDEVAYQKKNRVENEGTRRGAAQFGQVTYMSVGKIQYPHPRTVIFGKSHSISKVIREKGALLNAERLANPKNFTFPRVFACTRGDFRFLWKNRIFLVVLSAFGRLLAFWASPLKNHGHLGYSFGVQAWEENKRPHSKGVTRSHLMGVFVIYCVSSTQNIHWMASNNTREGWSSVFFPGLHSKGVPKMAMVFQRVRIKMPKSTQNDQKKTRCFV